MLRTMLNTLIILASFWWAKLTGNATRERVDGLIYSWAVRLLRVVDVKPRVVGNKPVYMKHQPYIIMSNHASLYDIPIILASLPGSIRMISKKELYYVPLFGKSIKHAEFIFIDRKNRAQAIQDLKKAKTKMQNGIIIWAAPEGTRSRDGHLGVFKKGIFKLAIETHAMIIPVGIRGARELLPPKTWQFHPGQNIEVHIGEPISAAHIDETTLSHQVRHSMLDLLTK